MVLAFDGVVEDCLCCNKCPTEGDVEVTVSGFTLCECLFNGSQFAKITAFSGITGAYPVPLETSGPTGTTWYAEGIGSVTLQFYTDMCETEDGDPSILDVAIRVSCLNDSGDDNLNVLIFVTGAGPGPLVFFNNGGQFSTAINNPTSCGDFANYAIVSTVTVDPPP